MQKQGRAATSSIMILAALMLIAFGNVCTPLATMVTTIGDEQLHTWWHANHEINDETPVADGSVRRSKYYDVRIAKAVNPGIWYNSFTYMSIPRGGRQKWGYDDSDGAEFASSARFTMSWSSFLYATDVTVEITLKDGSKLTSIGDVTFRPRQVSFAVSMINDSTIRFTVPYSADGLRFSVEFAQQLVDVYNDAGTLNIGHTGAFVNNEPRNALLIFAEPLPKGAEATRTIPTAGSGTIHYPREGQVDNLDTISQQVVFFQPGNYFMPWNYHAQLPANVKWVYFAPGSFVKGAIQFLHDTQPRYKVTGYGVLSGEKYVYEADLNNDYRHRDLSQPDCHGSCVKMLRFASSGTQQSLDLQGLTIVEPPYHSLVVYGDESSFEMHVDNYKQVGSWYWQTDGIELYQGSVMKNTFFHATDDVLKLYHSKVRIDNTVIWKNENGPVFQWGWVPREIDSVTVRNTFVIHSRMSWNYPAYNTCIVNSSSHYADMSATNLADPTKTIRNITLDGIYVEGACNCAVRIFALSKTENVTIRNLFIDEWSGLSQEASHSLLKAHTNTAGTVGVTIGNQVDDSVGIRLINYKIGEKFISRTNDNWQAENLGKLNFDGSLFNSWDAWVDTVDTGIVGNIQPASSFPRPHQVRSGFSKIFVSPRQSRIGVPAHAQRIEAFNLMGKRVYCFELDQPPKGFIDLPSTSDASGIYLVKISCW